MSGRDAVDPRWVHSAHLQVHCEFGDDELIEACAFGLRFAGQGGVERLGNAHVELAAVLAILRTRGRFRQAVDQAVDLPALVHLSIVPVLMFADRVCW